MKESSYVTCLTVLSKDGNLRDLLNFKSINGIKHVPFECFLYFHHTMQLLVTKFFHKVIEYIIFSLYSNMNVSECHYRVLSVRSRFLTTFNECLFIFGLFFYIVNKQLFRSFKVSIRSLQVVFCVIGLKLTSSAAETVFFLFQEI